MEQSGPWVPGFTLKKSPRLFLPPAEYFCGFCSSLRPTSGFHSALRNPHSAFLLSMPAAKPFAFVCGADDFLVGRLGRERFDSLVAEAGADEFSREIISGFAGNMGEVEIAVNRLRESIQTVPMFGGRRVVWLKDVNFLADTVTGRAEGTLKLVEDLQALLERTNPAETAVLITAAPVDRRRSFPKWCEKNAECTLIGGDGEGAAEALAGVVLAEARTLGVSFEPDALQLLLARLGPTRASSSPRRTSSPPTRSRVRPSPRPRSASSRPMWPKAIFLRRRRRFSAATCAGRSPRSNGTSSQAVTRAPSSVRCKTATASSSKYARCSTPATCESACVGSTACPVRRRPTRRISLARRKKVPTIFSHKTRGIWASSPEARNSPRCAA